ncbi:MAG: DUF433 domain-containing protein [Anaerolineae bacterium]|nr:DUF433 domain-containing protein [Anaerolineae bacterium]
MQEQLVIKSYIELRDGHARIAGRNLKAEYVARKHVAGGESIEAVMEHYDLTRAEVYAALAYYYENRAVLDAEYAHTIEQALADGTMVDSQNLKARIQARRKGPQESAE